MPFEDQESADEADGESPESLKFGEDPCRRLHMGILLVDTYLSKYTCHTRSRVVEPPHYVRFDVVHTKQVPSRPR